MAKVFGLSQTPKDISFELLSNTSYFKFKRRKMCTPTMNMVKVYK